MATGIENMMSKRYENIINAALFVTLAAIVLSGLTWLFRSNDYLGRANISGFRREKDIDVVFIGPSTVMDYYDPFEAWGEYGIVSYNYSGVGIRGNLTKEYLEDIRKSHDPMVYVVDLTTFEDEGSDINEGGLRNWSDSLSPVSTVRLKGLTHYLRTHDIADQDILSYYLDLIRYHNNTDNLKNSLNWLFLNPSNRRGSRRGFEPLLEHVVSDMPQISEERMDGSRVRTEDLDGILDYCDDHDLNVIFTFNPVCNGSFDKRNAIGDVITDRGYEFMDLNRCYEEMGLDCETDFANAGHVNYLGALKYTDYMARYLKDHYDIPDHRGEKVYEDMAEEYEDYKVSSYVWRSGLETEIENDRKNAAVGETLKETADPGEWLAAIDKGNFCIIVCACNSPAAPKNGVSDYEAVKNKWNIQENTGFIGVWDNEACLYHTDSETMYEGEIGRTAAKAELQVDISEKNSISIDGINIVDNNEDGVCVVIYDTCYRRVVDSVIISVDGDGEAVLER